MSPASASLVTTPGRGDRGPIREQQLLQVMTSMGSMGVRELLLAAVAVHACFGFQQSIVDIHKCDGQYLRMCHHGTSEAIQRVLSAGLQQLSEDGS